MASNSSVRSKWEMFVSQNRDPHFLTDEEKWDSSFEKAKEFLAREGRRPIQKSVSGEEKVLACWIHTQVKNYSPDIGECKWTMASNSSVRSKWEAFVSQNRDPHFLTDEEKWYSSLEKAKEFLAREGRRPIHKSVSEEEKYLAGWIGTQVTNYSPDIGKCKNIMASNSSVRSKWEAFVSQNRDRFPVVRTSIK